MNSAGLIRASERVRHAVQAVQLPFSMETLERRLMYASITWTGASAGTWGTASNWDLNRAPTTGDDVTIGTGVTVTVATTGALANSIISNGNLVIDATGELALSAASDFNGAVSIFGGSLRLVGGTIDGPLNWTGGTFFAGGATSNAAVNLSGDADKLLRGTLTTTGNVVHSAGLLRFDRPGDLFVNGTYEIQGTAGINEVSLSGGATADLVIAGTFRKTGAGENRITLSTGTRFALNAGTIEVDAGTLVIDSASGTITGGGTLDIAPGATLSFDNVDLTMDETLSGTGGGTINYNGILTSAGAGLTLNFAQNMLNWTGGIFRNAPDRPIINTGFLTLTGDNDKTNSGTEFFNRGRLIHTGAGNFVNSAGGSRFNNDPTGIYNFRTDAGMTGGTFINNGTLRKTDGAGVTQIASSYTAGAGEVVEVTTGTLAFDTNTHEGGGTFSVATGSTLALTGGVGQGNSTFGGTYTGTGGGTILHAARFILTSGTGATFNMAEGLFQWVGGNISAGPTAPFRTEGFFNVSGDDPKVLGGTFINAGTWRHASGAITQGGFASGFIFQNLAGSVYDFTGGGSIGITIFENAGTVRKSAGADTATFTSTFNHLPGAFLEVTSGRLAINAGGTISAGNLAIVAGAALDLTSALSTTFTGGTFTNTGTGKFRVRAGGMLSGDEASPPTFNFSPGVFEWNQAVIFGPLTNAGDLTITGDVSTFVTSFTNTGTIAHTSSADLSIFDTSTLTNAGTYDLQTNAGFVSTGRASGPPGGIVNTGTLRKSGGTGVSRFRDDQILGSFIFDNTGTLEVLSGTFEVPAYTRQFSSFGAARQLTAGTWRIGAGANLSLMGGITASGGQFTDSPARPITRNGATVILDGPGSQFPQFDALATNDGSFTVTNGRNFATLGNLANAGTLTAGPNATLSVNGTLTTTGTLAFVVGGTNASNQFGKINTVGAATLAGTAAVSLASGFGPSTGDAYTLMTFPSRTGDFASVTGLDPFFQSSITDTTLRLNATSGVQAADLAVIASSITLPANASVGQQVTVGYTVQNLSTSAVAGSWTDTLFLSTDTIFDPSDVRLGRIDITDSLAENAIYTRSLDANIPALPTGVYHVIIRADSRLQIIDDDRANNVGASTSTITLSIPTLPLDVPVTRAIAEGQDLYYQLDLNAVGNLLLSLDLTTTLQAEFFVSQGTLPTRSTFDFTASNLFELQRRLAIASASVGRYFILIHGREGADAGQPFTLTAQQVTFAATSASPLRGSNVGTSTITLTGAGFTRATVVELIDGANNVAFTGTVSFRSADTIDARFDLLGATVGNYTLRVTVGANVATIPEPFQVVADDPGALRINVLMPSAARIDRVFTAYVEYANTGSTDLISPTIYLQSPSGSFFTLDPVAQPDSAASRLVIGIGNADPVGVLRPGEVVRLPVRMVANQQDNQLTALLTQASSTNTVDWARERHRLMAGMTLSDPTFLDVFNRMAEIVGTTAGQYVAMLARNASLLPPLLGDARDPAAAMRLELSRTRASLGTSISGTLLTTDSSIDLSNRTVTAVNSTTGNSWVTTSLKDGTFIFDTLTAGDYTFTVSGLAVAPVPAFALAAGQSATGVDLTVVQPTQLMGNVVSASSAAVAKASIVFLDDSGAFVSAALTDENGVYTTDLRPGTYRVMIEATGNARTTVNGVVVTAGDNTRNIQLSEPGKVIGVGTVVGQPVSTLFAIATLNGDNTDLTQNRFSQQGSTGGTFSLDGLVPGTYVVTLISGNNSVVLPNVVVAAGQTVDLGSVAISPPLSQVVPFFDLATGRVIAAPLADEAVANPGNPEAFTTNDPITLEQLSYEEIRARSITIPALTAKYGVEVGAMWEDYLNGSGTNQPTLRSFGDFSAIVEGNNRATGFRESASVPNLDLQYNVILRYVRDRLEAEAEQAAEEDAEEFSESENGDLGSPCTPPPVIEDGSDPDEDPNEDDEDEDAERGFTVRVADVPGFESVLDFSYSSILEIPGNIAGGSGPAFPIGNPHGGAFGQQFADTRLLQGFFSVVPQGDGQARILFFVEMNVSDTIDFLPGDPGTGLEQVITGPLAFLEAYDRAYDVPFNVLYTLRDEFPDTTITYTVPEKEEPEPEPTPLDDLPPGDGGDDGCGPGDGGRTPSVGSRDPNNKITSGVIDLAGDPNVHFILPGTALPYIVNFENVPTATAPAQEVFITDVLDDDLDLSTFTLGDFGFGDTVVDVPDGLTFFSTRVDVLDTLGCVVDVEMSLNFDTRTVDWVFRSIDPTTGDLVSDPFGGFLPANDSTGRGEGFVSYTVSPFSDRGNGTRIENSASIVFDTNEAIVTNTAINVVDELAPSSGVLELPVNSSETFTVTWAGNDNAGSGVRTYDVFVSKDGGAYTLWQNDTTATSAPARGTVGSTYTFYSVATDRLGFVEPAAALSQASTTITAVVTPSFTTAVVEPDPTNGGALRLVVTGTSGNDVIEVNRIGRGGSIRYVVKADGQNIGTFQDVRHILINGNAGNDYIRVDDNIRADVSIFGGDGNDDLKAGQKRAFLFGDAGDDRLTSTARSALLDGGAGNDSLLGDHGSDVLIGGDGADYLKGGRGEDLLVAGPVSADLTTDDLITLRSRWSGSGSYYNRIEAIQSPAFLARLIPGETVLNDTAIDVLKGGNWRDWFLADRSATSSRDEVLDPWDREVITDIAVGVV